MPNIIEQQDLLKGLPDNRLAMMMQNPTGDIPPFLVAAEAQRRQAIRQQFSGGPQESVVDTLTKQLASVPQNIQAPAQQPPRLPPPQMPSQMAGVAALQQQMPQQQMQQAPQQAMRNGGMVQRYQEGSLVMPSLRGRAGSGGYMPGEEPDSSSILGDLYNAAINSEFTQRLGKYGVNPTEERVAQLAEEVKQSNAPASDPFNYGMTREERQMMQTAPEVQTANPVAPRDPNAAKDGTSIRNKMTLDEYRRQLEGIYGVNAEDSEYIKGKLEELYGGEVSGWEKSQKWFAAAQAAMQPGQNNWQVAVNALSALGAGMADERASERENQQALAEALLRYEMADMQERRKSEQAIAAGALEYGLAEQKSQEAREAAAAERELKAYELFASKAGSNIEAQNRMLMSLEKDKADYIESIRKNSLEGTMPDLSTDPYLISINEQIRAVRERMESAEGMQLGALANYGRATGTDPSVMVYQPGRLTPYGK